MLRLVVRPPLFDIEVSFNPCVHVSLSDVGRPPTAAFSSLAIPCVITRRHQPQVRTSSLVIISWDMS